VVGFRTWFSVAKLDGTAGRKFYAPNRHDTPEQVITRLRRYGDDRTIWIAGGAATYRKWLPVVQECHISILDYDGPCDVVMPPLWVPRPVSPDDWRTSHGPAP
jgi:dihydrofolate reductase